jgi:hypothetical protein
MSCMNEKDFVGGYWWIPGYRPDWSLKRRAIGEVDLTLIKEPHRGSSSKGLDRYDAVPVWWELLRRHPDIVRLRMALDDRNPSGGVKGG